MRKTNIFMAVLLAAFGTAHAGVAVDSPIVEKASIEIVRFQFVGVSEALVDGAAGGLLVMNQLCQAEFPASRLCSKEEIDTTTVWPSLPVGGMREAWVNLEANNCGGWFPGGAARPGYWLDLDAVRYFNDSTCSVARRLTCCALVRSFTQTLAEVVIARRELAGDLVELFQ